MAGNNNSTFIQLPSDISNPILLRRFLDKLVQELDVAFGNRGSKGFITANSLLNYADVDTFEELAQAFLELYNNYHNGVLIESVTANKTIASKTSVILVDCSLGDVTISLPSCLSSFTNNRSIEVGITKVDSSSNKVIIQPNSELICGESTQELLYQNEVLNIVTDGSNWYLGA